MNWKYAAINQVDQISLHDCSITSARFENRDLILSFEDGFKALSGLEQNPSGAVTRTGEFELVFPECEDFCLRIHAYRCFHFFKWDFYFGRRWQELDRESPEQFLSFFAHNPTEIVDEYHSCSLSAHHYECSVWNMHQSHDLLSLVRLRGKRLWRPLFGTRAYERFEKKHWEDDYDDLSISFSRNGFVSLTVSVSPFQNERIIYRWNECLPDKCQ